jgi:hypothetical protein
MHAVGELDHNDRALARSAYQSSNNCARSSAELAEHNLHNSNPSTLNSREHKGLSPGRSYFTR